MLDTWRRAVSAMNAESAMIEAPRGVEFLGRGVPLHPIPSRLGDLGSIGSSPSGVRCEAPAANAF